jgi:putative glutamine amidotransferase
MSLRIPLVAIPTCFREVNERVMYTAVVRYPHAVVDAAGCLPMLIPSIGEKLDIEALLDTIDGLLLTGSPSNVEPFHYQGPPSREGTLHDPDRDATTLPLIREAVRRDMPVLAICRGIQELNVALGGTSEILVKSLHGQGIDTPAPGLRIEAVAPDGLIEAVSLPTARFVVGVQWHPEYKPLNNPVSRALFGAFGDACREAAKSGTAAKRRAA